MGKEALKVERWEFSFEKIRDDTFYIIQFAPMGFSIEELFDMAVWLYRSTYRDVFAPPPGGRMTFRGSLAHYYLAKKDDFLGRWHFVKADDIRKEYTDILDRLLRYGIPLLEDSSVTWERWHGVDTS